MDTPAKTHAMRRVPSALPVVQTAGQGKMAVNTATLEELQALPGVGPAMAQAIIAERETNGPFGFPEDLLNVKGIGPKKLDGLMSHITLE